MATTYPATISVTSLDGKNGFTVLEKRGDRFDYGKVSSAGDVNGDGFDDLVVGFRHVGGPIEQSVSYVLFGRSSGFAPSFAWPSLNGSTGFAITGNAGPYVSSAGDLNGDGIDDIAIGSLALIEKYGQPWEGGSVNVIFGTRAGSKATFPLSSLDGKNGFQISDRNAEPDDDRFGGLGYTMASAGDVNGDGFDDLIVGARGEQPGWSKKVDSGSVFVIYGGKSGFKAKLDIADLDGTNGSRIFIGRDGQDHGIGASVGSAGDVNGDGLADIIVQAAQSSYVVFGRKGGFGANLDLKTLNGRNGFTISRRDSDHDIESIDSAGDINGDGIDDLIVWEENNWYKDGISSGLHVVFGKKTGFDAKITLDSLSATDGFRISGPFLRLEVSRIGDFNGDGIDDIAISSSQKLHSPDEWGWKGSNGDAANVFIVFGKKDGFKSSVSLEQLDGKDGVRITGLPTDPTISSAGDINGDGAADLVIGAGWDYITGSKSLPTYVVFGNTSFAGLKRDGGNLDETLTGANNGDVLNGLGGADRLIGLAGDDRLDGGTGIDRMEGGVGDDTYFVDQSRDVVVEGVDQGNDTVISTASYKLAAGNQIETLRLDPQGRANLSLTGNEFNSSLYGNAGNNLLNGLGGNDRLYGGAGNDTYIVGPSGHPDYWGSVIYERDDEGQDRILALTSYTLNAGSSVESMQLLTATKRANLNLTGNEYSQIISGNGGRNVLDGQGSSYEKSRGADSLYGQGGDDVYIIRRSDDKVYEAAKQGKDTVTSTVSYKLAAGQSVEVLQFRDLNGYDNLDLSGNELGNALYGNRGSNVLDGGAGADVLNGREGTDVLSGGSGADSFRFSTKLGANNIDRITDFEASDTIELAKTVFKALAPGQLPGSAFKDLGVSGAKLDVDDRIVYDSRTGALSYDADGSGAGAAVQFATLVNKATLGAGDFLVL
ncbi:hypothetical protein [Methylorubrum sp. SB2]|uniref:hypothetical protein n=1 Tax=Methylorubrum subtropicum TaxID=3138812 RepID=UPI00313CAF2A